MSVNNSVWFWVVFPDDVFYHKIVVHQHFLQIAGLMKINKHFVGAAAVALVTRLGIIAFDGAEIQEAIVVELRSTVLYQFQAFVLTQVGHTKTTNDAIEWSRQGAYVFTIEYHAIGRWVIGLGQFYHVWRQIGGGNVKIGAFGQ